MRLIMIAAVYCVSVFPVWAEENSSVDSAGLWSGNADIGYSASDGNSETENLNAAGKVEYLKGLWSHGLRLNLVREDDNGTVNAERYEVGYKAKRALSDVSYIFGNLAYERDEFGGVFERTSETVGYGRQLFKTDIHALATEVGIGARQSELQDGTEEEDAILRLGAEYQRALSDTAKFNQDLVVEAGEENTYVESVSAMKVRINGNLYGKMSYTVKYNDTVPVGIDDTDTYTSLSLSYEFGNH